MALAEKVLNTLENKRGDFKPLYTDEMPLKDKIGTIASEIYGADGVSKRRLCLCRSWLCSGSYRFHHDYAGTS